MVDWLEELLTEAAEQDGEGQEDVSALDGTGSALAEFPRGAEAGMEADAEPDAVELGDRGGGRTAGEIAADGPGLAAGEDAAAGPGTERLGKDGTVWTAREAPAETGDGEKPGPGEWTVRDGWEAAPAGAMGRLGLDGARLGAEGAGKAAADRRGLAAGEDAALAGLYRQTVRAAIPAAPALPQGTASPAAPALAQGAAGRAVRAREPEGAAALAVEELDRAVRRDSRRYDGGMTIF